MDDNVFGALGDLFREADDEFEDPRGPAGGAGSMTAVCSTVGWGWPCSRAVRVCVHVLAFDCRNRRSHCRLPSVENLDCVVY